MNYYSIQRGGVYQLLNKQGTLSQGLYLVISSNKYNQDSPNVMICSIREQSKAMSPYQIEYNQYTLGTRVPMCIIVENIFNVAWNRLVHYKYTLSEELMDKVQKVVMNVMFGCELYTMDQAKVKIFDQRLNLEEEPEEPYDEVEMEEDNMSIDEVQAHYARTVLSSEPKLLSRKVPEKRQLTRFKNIYAKYNDFLLDYFTLSTEELMEKWNIEEKDIKARVERCRVLSRQNGDDQTFWNQAGREKRRNG